MRAAITRRCDPLSDADGRIATDRKAALRKAAATREPQPLPALSGEQLSELLRLLGRRHRRAEADCHRCDAQTPSACGRGGRHAGRLRLLGLARAVLDQAEVKDVLAGRRPVRKLFSASLSSNTSLTGEGDWHAAQVEPPKGPCQWRDWSFAWEVSERGRNSLH